MQRCPEPELMSDQAQAVAYSQADFSSGDQVLIEQLKPLLVNRGPRLKIVDIGCGPGNITLRLAKQWSSAEVIGIDGSAPMLTLARERAEQQGSVARFLEASIQELITTPLPDAIASADVIVSNSVLHHLHDPLQFWRLVAVMGAPGSVVLHRDLRRPDSETQLNQLQQRYLPDAPACLIDDYRASLRAAFTIDEVQSQLEVLGLERFSVREEDDRYLSVIGVL